MQTYVSLQRSTGYPEELRKLFNISERQYFQMDLLALALHRDWRGIEGMVMSKGVLGFGKKKKSPIGFERVVRMLGQEKYRTPDNVSHLRPFSAHLERYREGGREGREGGEGGREREGGRGRGKEGGGGGRASKLDYRLTTMFAIQKHLCGHNLYYLFLLLPKRSKS